MNYLKVLALSILLFSMSVQAKENCWSAGVLDGMCYQQGSETRVNYKEPVRTPSNSKCWTAGALGGMCYDSPVSGKVSRSATETPSCWTAGVLNGMCY